MAESTKMPLSEIVIGQKLTDVVYVLKALSKDSERVNLILSDKTGELISYMPLSRYDAGYEKMTGGAVKVNGIVEVGKDHQPLGKIRSLALADAGDFNVQDLFEGISEEKTAEIISTIGNLIKRIPDVGCRKLCQCLLTEDTLRQMASYPASLAYHGRYRGGALVSTCAVTQMAIRNALEYTHLKHDMYEQHINWSILVTSSLLMNVAIMDYLIDNPWRKSQIAIDRGYMSLLQSRIERAVIRDDVQISDEALARIFNVLGSSVALKTAVKATCIEGVILRYTLLMYEEMDMLDAEMDRHETKEGEAYFYNRRLSRNIATNNIEEVKAA